MAFAIAALAADGPSTIDGAERSPSPIRASSTRWRRARLRVKADKVYLVGFMARRQDHAGARAREAPRTGGPSTSTSSSSSANTLTVAEIFAEARRAVLPRGRTRRARRPARRPHIVVATGGGTFVDPQNRAVINRDGVSVWLDVPLDALIARVPADGRRPLAADRAELRTLYHQRRARVPAGAHPARRRPRQGVERAGRDETLGLGLERSASESMRYPRPDRHPREPRGARRLPRRCARRAVTTRRSCSAISSATAPTRTRSSTRAGARAGRDRRGNHDKVACGLEQAEGFNVVAKSAARWTLETLTPANRDVARGAARTGPMLVDDLVEICHGSPFDEDAYIFDELDAVRALKVADAAALPVRPHALSGDLRAVGGRLRCGWRRPSTGEMRLDASSRARSIWSTPASVGQPRDGDPRAAYAIVDAERLPVELFRFELPDRRGAGQESSRRACRRCSRSGSAVGPAELRRFGPFFCLLRSRSSRRLSSAAYASRAARDRESSRSRRRQQHRRDEDEVAGGHRAAPPALALRASRISVSTLPSRRQIVHR